MTTVTEDLYLRAIHVLSEKQEQGAVSTNALASEMRTTPASVTDMLKKLREKRLVSYKPYYGVKLTEQGTAIALQLLYRQEVWAQFLEQELQLPEPEIRSLAPQFAVVRDEKLIQSIVSLIGEPSSNQAHPLAS
jgi:DtxR family Mn-dependent transcriptional regulator